MSASDVPSISRRVLQAVLVGIGLLICAVVLSLRAMPSEGRPLIHPCQDDSGCTTQTHRPGGFQIIAPLAAEGHRATVSGHLDCSAGTHYVIEVDVEQNGTVATGRSQQPCRAGTWSVHVHTTSGDALFSGAAEACAELFIYSGNTLVGSRTWCAQNGVTLD